jgi:hypothetical protein
MVPSGAITQLPPLNWIRALQSPAIAFDQIAAILERSADAVGSRCTLRQPVRDMADHVGALQGDEARNLHEVDVHADQQRDAPDRRVENLVAEIASRAHFGSEI